MDKIVKGKRYNTETAKHIGSKGEEELYHKQTGEFFLCFSGKVKPLTYEAAQGWVMENLPEEYDNLFKKVDDGTLIYTSVRLTPTLHAKLKREALRRGISLRVLIIEILTLYKTGDPR